MKNIIPDIYREMTEEELVERIAAVKARLGAELLILAHHYQREMVAAQGDFRGDSFLLSKQAAATSARWIVFCGVHFMAESAAVLARAGQAVFIPDPQAGCPMAEMASPEQVEKAWAELGKVTDLRRLVPITYVNSTAAVKAFCGERGGATCTSSNAERIFHWALGEKEKIFFLPDEHLGRNTAAKMHAGPVALWDPARPRGGLSSEEIRKARVIVWKGYCHVHTIFTADQIAEKRRAHPGCRVIVHPECCRETVAAADVAGSTEGIITFTAAAPPASTVVIGTEIHLVERLAREYAGHKTVVPLARSLCPNMFRINLHNLLWVLERIEAENPVNQVTVPEAVRAGAAAALERMLEKAG